MPKRAKQLSAWNLKRLKPGVHAVGGVAGLYLQLRSETAACWILRVKLPSGKRRHFGLGSFPEITLEAARTRARETREQVLKGADPVRERLAAVRAAEALEASRLTFEQAARQCWQTKSQEFKNPKHAAQWINTLVQYAFPRLGKLHVQDITRPIIVQVLEPIWTTRTETATRVRGRIEAVIAWAKAAGAFVGENPAAWADLKPLLAAPTKIKKVEHHAALPWQRMPEFMQKLRAEPGIAARCQRFAVLTNARSEEARGAMYSEIDLDAKVWTIPAERMKGRKLHKVPLVDEAVQLIKDLPRAEVIVDGKPQLCELLFPSPRKGTVLSDNTLGKVVERIIADMPGIEHATAHGMRSAFKDWARNQPGHDDEATELCLAHVNNDKTRAAYARDMLMNKRTVIMRAWGRYCAQKPQPASVVPMNRGEARRARA